LQRRQHRGSGGRLPRLPRPRRRHRSADAPARICAGGRNRADALQALSAMTVWQLVEQLKALGVREGGVLLVHTSFRAVRPVEGGPIALIEALHDALGPEGTLVMPTMTDDESPFDPAATPTWQMGIASELFWRRPGGRH